MSNLRADRPRVGIVTGGGGGLGRAIARELAGQGLHLVILGRSSDTVGETVRQVKALGGSADGLVGDVSIPDSVARCARRCEELGDVEILINNAAGLGPLGPMWECDPDAWLRTTATDYGGVFLWMRAILPGMVARGRGWIVNISGGGAIPRPGSSAYSAAKAAVVKLTEAVAAELRGRGVCVNALAPGALPTPMLDRLQAAEREHCEFLGFGEPLEPAPDALRLAAQAAVFLATCDHAITGRLVSAKHDPWREWAEGVDVPREPWFTLRRLDPHTLRQVTGAGLESRKLSDD